MPTPTTLTPRERELADALAGVLLHITSGDAYRTSNPYLRPCVQTGLHALGHATGFSTFGHDWMDTADKYEESKLELENTTHG